MSFYRAMRVFSQIIPTKPLFSRFVVYIDHSWGGAVKTLEYAIRSKKNYMNIGKWNKVV